VTGRGGARKADKDLIGKKKSSMSKIVKSKKG